MLKLLLRLRREAESLLRNGKSMKIKTEVLFDSLKNYNSVKMQIHIDPIIRSQIIEILERSEKRLDDLILRMRLRI